MAKSRTDDVFERLRRSPFRQRFRLRGSERDYLDRKGLDVVLGHGRDFIAQRLAPANPPNDGKQTPYRGHPVFVAQHATATCCRSCLHRNHGISPGAELTPEQQEYVVRVIVDWIDAELSGSPS